ncbi:MAG: ribonuclease Y [Planctomycetes bacterium]|nr:ribonuclease Y [Planctomycetota bacterium]
MLLQIDKFLLGITLLEEGSFDGGTLAIGLVIGLLVGALAIFLVNKGNKSKSEKEAQEKLEAAKRDAESIRTQAELKSKEEIVKRREEFSKEIESERKEIVSREKRLDEKLENLDKRLNEIQRRENKVEEAQKRATAIEDEARKRRAELDDVISAQKSKLSEVAKMSPEEAKREWWSTFEVEVAEESAQLLKKKLREAEETAEDQARHFITTAIQRVCTNHTADCTVSMVDLPSEDLKGRIIGREGRNIRAFERMTGCDVVVDDTPGVVVLSAFDGVRREIARKSMERLIEDGRIHPARIEEIVLGVQKEMDKDITETGKQTLFDLGIHGVHPKISWLLGRLKYRTSYGQNVLLHSIEVANICATIAGELGLDEALAKRAGLLHDVGKAVDHEHEGGHPAIGGEYLRKFHEKEEVIEAAAGHHFDIEIHYPYTVLAHVGDAISASRPGARRESIENYVKRLEKLEAVATSQAGVTQAFAIQAGRELRVIVDSDVMNDEEATLTARKIAKQIENELEYPGEVRVTLMREKRVVEYAK